MGLTKSNMFKKKYKCFRCSNEFDSEEEIGKGAQCPKCGSKEVVKND